MVRQIAAHYEGSEGLARPATAVPSDRQRALRSEGSSLLALRPGTAGLVLDREGTDDGLHAGVADQLGVAGGPAVPEQVDRTAWCAHQLGFLPVHIMLASELVVCISSHIQGRVMTGFRPPSSL